MTDDLNPYQSPEAPLAEDFIAYEPIRRPISNVVAAASCFAVSAFVLTIEGLCLLESIDRLSKVGTRWERQPTHLGWRELMILSFGCSALSLALAGHSFWVRRDRPGLILFLAGLLFFGVSLIPPFLFLRS
jgi:hypothetical protein